MPTDAPTWDETVEEQAPRWEDTTEEVTPLKPVTTADVESRISPYERARRILPPGPMTPFGPAHPEEFVEGMKGIGEAVKPFLPSQPSDFTALGMARKGAESLTRVTAPVMEGLHEALAPAISDWMRVNGVDPSSSPESLINTPPIPASAIPRMPGMPPPEVSAAAANTVIDTLKSFAQPENAALMLSTGGGGAIGKAAAVIFASPQFAALPDQVQMAIRTINDPNATKEQKYQAVLQPGVNTIVAGAMVRAGFKPEPVARTGKPVRRLAPPPEGRQLPPPVPAGEAVPPPIPTAPVPPPPEATPPPVPTKPVPPEPPPVPTEPVPPKPKPKPPTPAAVPELKAADYPLPPKKTSQFVRIKTGDGTVIPAYFEGAYSVAPGTPYHGLPWISYLTKEGTWTTGFLHPGDVIIDKITPPKITEAAFMPEGATVPETGAHHPGILKRLGITGFETPESRNTPQFGFVDETGKFLTREEAAERAKATGQDLKTFEPNEPAHSNEIASPTQPEKPLSEAPTRTTPTKAPQWAIDELRSRGWNLKWPFVPADLRNQDFIDLIKKDPSISPEEKAKILSFAPGGENEVKIGSAPTKPAMVTLYRGEGGTGGIYFSDNPIYAAKQGPNVVKVDVPKSVADAARKKFLATGNATKGAHILPDEWSKKAEPVTRPPMVPVYDTDLIAKAAEDKEAAAAPAVEPAAAKAQAEVSKVAATEGKKSAADVKQELIDELQQKLMKAPAVVKPGDKVTVDIPGDGVFTIPNDIEAISAVLERARKIKTDAGKAPGVPKKAIKSSSKAIREGEVQAAVKKTEETPAPPAEPAPVGMGAAVSSEFELNPQTPTGIKNATVDAERQRRGLPPAIQPLRRAFGEVWDRAMAMIDHDPGIVDTLVDSLRDKPRALTDLEDAILLHRQVDLQNEYGKATRDLAQAFEDGRTDAVASEKLRVARLSDQLFDLYNIGKKVGTETGRGLAARRMMVNEDFSLAQMELEKRAAKGGRPLTDAERQEVANLHTRIAETERAYKEYRDAFERRLVELETARSLAELKAKTVPTFDKRILAHAETIVQRMETAAKPAADRLRERLARMSVGVDPTIVSDAAIVGSAKIARLGLDLARFSDEMVRDFGEKIRPMMADIWREANRIIDATVARVPDPVKAAIKKAASTVEVKEAVTKSIADKFAKGQKDKISWEVQRLARELVKNGVTDREELIDQIHGLLQDAIPGITRREAMDAISGYGDFKQLTRDQISVTLRGMKGEMQQLAKLEDMAAGQAPLKSGVERRTPTDAERQLIKRVNEAKLKFQVPTTDPATQLRSALDTLKTGLRNRIADYEDRIARGDFAKRPRRNIDLDPEAQRLQAQIERVRKEFQRGVQLDRLKNLSRVDRTSDWVVKWRRGFILSGPVTLAKLTSAALQRLSITPAEELIGGAIGKAIPQVAGKAAREGGFNVRAEAKAITEGLTTGMRDAWQVLRTGQSDLDVLYGRAALVPPSVIDFFGHVHGALKAPVKRAEFARSFEKRSQAAIAGGVDVSDPMVQSKLVIEAYQDANRAIFQQDNRVVAAYKRALGALEQPDKTSGRVPLVGKAAATTARVLLPIVKIPTNIVAETMQYATGSVTGSLRLGRAFARGIETLQPEEADLIMRSLKKGSLGAAVMLLGYFNADIIGGYYQQGEKRKPGQPKFGTIDLWGYQIPSYLIHNPLLETMQIGATVRRVAESKLSRKDAETQGITSGVLAAGLGLTEEVPFVRETMETAKAFNPHERGAFFGELAKSLAVPQLLQSVAAYRDVDRYGHPVQRKPGTTLQHVEMGIPGLRETVPEKRQTQPQ